MGVGELDAVVLMNAVLDLNMRKSFSVKLCIPGLVATLNE